jgi:hypothetical protein
VKIEQWSDEAAKARRSRLQPLLGDPPTNHYRDSGKIGRWQRMLVKECGPWINRK